MLNIISFTIISSLLVKQGGLLNPDPGKLWNLKRFYNWIMMCNSTRHGRIFPLWFPLLESSPASLNVYKNTVWERKVREERDLFWGIYFFLWPKRRLVSPCMPIYCINKNMTVSLGWLRCWVNRGPVEFCTEASTSIISGATWWKKYSAFTRCQQ